MKNGLSRNENISKYANIVKDQTFTEKKAEKIVSSYTIQHIVISKQGNGHDSFVPLIRKDSKYLREKVTVLELAPVLIKSGVLRIARAPKIR